jgi:hypothetical protein
MVTITSQNKPAKEHLGNTRALFARHQKLDATPTSLPVQHVRRTSQLVSMLKTLCEALMNGVVFSGLPELGEISSPFDWTVDSNMGHTAGASVGSTAHGPSRNHYNIRKVAPHYSTVFVESRYLEVACTAANS